ncbi:MAG: B12-binding domain-containing radical SAM protein [Acidimicrobiales bacterium]
MRVLIGHAYFQYFDPKLEEAMRPYPPLGTLVAAGLAREAGHDVQVFDAMLERSTARWDEAIAERPDVAVLFEDNFNYLSKMCLSRMREAAFDMLATARDAQVPAIVCGSDASDHCSEFLDAGATAVIRGEGDEALIEALAALDAAALAAGGDTASSSAATLAGIAGLTVRGEDGELVNGPDRKNLKALDDLPFPARDLVDLDRYRDIHREHHGRFSLNVVTTRGCPYHCNWCSKPIWGQRYNARSPEDVVAEIVELRRDHGVEHIWFADDIFGLKPGWIERFAELVEEHDVQLPFKCLSRPDLLVRRDTAELLGDAGAEEVWIGAESGSQRVLDAMEKGTTVAQIIEAADRVHAAGYRIAFFVQFGYPGETLDDIDATLALLWRARPDDIGISVAYPLPGTPFYDRVKAQLGADTHWVDSSDLAMLFDGPFPTEFYRALHERVHTEFRMRQLLWKLRPRSGGAPSLPRPRELARFVRDALRLVPQIRRVRRLAEPVADAVDGLPIDLDRDAAATPSAQPVEITPS